jgi:DNA-binding NarL/FixJ family response regulator
MAEHPIRVAIIEDDRPTCEGLRLLIDGTPGFRCISASSSVELARPQLERGVPDVLLLDIHLPGIQGSEAVRGLRADYPLMQILMITVYTDEDKVFESICSGACGYLLKKTPPARLLEAIAEVHGGGAPMSPEIARKVVTLFQKTGSPKKQEAHLAPQELKLMRLMSQGFSYEAAGLELNVSINTVRNYIRSIYDKLHVHSKSEAVGKALRDGIIG